MRDLRPLLEDTSFPSIQRKGLRTLQVNLGYRCNQSCFHCHVGASPRRTEMMDDETVDTVLAVLRLRPALTLDLTGGAPELHPRFRDIVRTARQLGVPVIDRCNLTILREDDQQDLAAFLAEQGVTVMASLPCYNESNVTRQRGEGVYERSIAALKMLNALGYGRPGTALDLMLVYNPVGPTLPPPQKALEDDYRRELRDRHGIVFSALHTITNMPIQRFGVTLAGNGGFDDYLTLLRANHCAANLDAVMCRNLVSVDYLGYIYDCDFNQMLGMPVLRSGQPVHVSALLSTAFDGHSIRVAGHCYGCTAGQGSSCGGALNA